MNRLLLFLIPFFFESITSFFLRSVTYFGMDLGGDQAQIGVINTIFIAAQIPLFFIVGKLVNKLGKYPVVYIGVLLITIFIFLTSHSSTLLMLTILVSVGFLGHALFYPAFQALIGDMSTGQKLTKDVGIYNMGWCIGGACAAVVQGPIVDFSHSVKGLLYVGLLCGLIDFVLLTINYFLSKNKQKVVYVEDNTDNSIPKHNDIYMLMGRIGVFLGFFSYGTFNFILPKILTEFGWSYSLCLKVTGMVVVGEAIGVIVCAFNNFWKMRILPQITSHIVYLLCALFILFARQSIILSILFFICGIAMMVCFTSSLFHAVSSHSKVRSKNTGYNELMIASAMVVSCLIGSLGGALNNLFDLPSMRYLPIYIIILGVMISVPVLLYLNKKTKG